MSVPPPVTDDPPESLRRPSPPPPHQEPVQSTESTQSTQSPSSSASPSTNPAAPSTPPHQPAAQPTTTATPPSPSALRKRTPADFKFGRTLGEGSYSTVVLAHEPSTSRTYAVKILDKKHIVREKKIKYVNIEKDVLNRMAHSFVVRLYYTFQDRDSLYFVLEYAEHGDLLGLVRRCALGPAGGGGVGIEVARFYLGQLVEAVEYLHSNRVIHRDLKPENILLDSKFHIKVTDFGSAKILDQSSEPAPTAATPSPSRRNSFVGTAEYCSPELLNDRAASEASDVWALGCILFQLLTSRPPFKAGNEYQTFQKILKLEYGFPPGFHEPARDLVERILVLKPESRLTSREVRHHAFFDGFDFEGLEKRDAPESVVRAMVGYVFEDDGFGLHNGSSTDVYGLPNLVGSAGMTSVLSDDSLGAPPTEIALPNSASEISVPHTVGAPTEIVEPHATEIAAAAVVPHTPPATHAELSRTPSPQSINPTPQASRVTSPSGPPNAATPASLAAFLRPNESVLRQGAVTRRSAIFGKRMKLTLVLTSLPRLLLFDPTLSSESLGTSSGRGTPTVEPGAVESGQLGGVVKQVELGGGAWVGLESKDEKHFGVTVKGFAGIGKSYVFESADALEWVGVLRGLESAPKAR
ncbi:3-phosphoinositide-dependent protein kinase 1 [Cladochytrium replicatum]|nr:3-phosphoinositide-dependent protein kinase 1 [Cladochytrium replicatum]